MSLYSRLDRVVADQDRLERKVDALANSPQSQRTSVEGGSIDFNDNDGNLKAIVGGQEDGGTTINVIAGPTPPTPVNYTVTVDHGSLTVHWDGEFEDDAVAPTDWARWTAYAQPGEFVVPERSTAIGGTDSASGGEVTAGVLKGQWTVTVLAWSQAGKPSAMGLPVTVDVPGYGDIVLAEIDAAETLIKNAGEILVTEQGTLGEKLAESDAALDALEVSLGELDETTLPALRNDLDAAEGRLDSAEGQITDAFGQIGTVQQSAEDAQIAADGAQATADSKAGIDYILSRGTDLVTNGTGYMGTNENFPAFTFDANDSPAGARGSFKTPATQNLVAEGAESMPVDSNRRYLLRASVRETNPNITLSRFYLGAAPIDTSGFAVQPPNYAHKPASIVTLTEPLNNGDKLVHVDDPDALAAGFADANGSYLAAWNYTDPAGKTWPVGTYTRNVTANALPVTREGTDGVRLNIPWSFGTVPAGTKVGVNYAGGNYMYIAATNQVAPKSWGTFYGATESGVHDGSTGVAATKKFPHGTAGAKLLFLANRSAAPSGQLSRQSFALLSFSDATLALNEAEAARAAAAAAQSTANTAQANAGTAQSAAVAAMDRANAVKGEAAADAQAKADAAAMAAESAAKAYALAQANDASADALAAAKADASDKADAARIAAEQAAAAHADSLPKVLHGTTVATGTAPDGSIWWQHQGTLSGPVVGQWNRVSGSWVSTPIRSEAIANLDAGKLTAGTATIAEAVVQKIAAQTASIQQADVKNLFVTGTSSLSDVVAERIAAETAEFIELEVGNLVAGTGTMDEATITKLFADVVVAGMSIATEFIGENAILTGAVTAPKITASEELWAKIGEFVKIRAEQIEADAIDGMVITGATFRTSGGSGSWSDAGLAISAPDGELLVNFPTNGEPLSLNADSTTIRSASIGELEAGDTSLTTGSTFTLEAGQQAYPRAPEIRADWQSAATFTRPDPGYSCDWTGLAAWGDKWVRTVNVLGSEGDSLDSIVVYTENGAVEKTILVDLNPRHGVAVIGDEAFVLGPDHVERPGTPKHWVHAFDLNTGNRTRRWEYTRAVQNRYALGSNGDRLLMAAVYNTTLYVHQWNPSTGAQVGPDATATWDLGYTKDLIGVHLDGTLLRIGHPRNIRTYTYSAGSLSRKNPDNQGWGNPSNNANGFDMSKGWPFVITESGNLFEGSMFDGDGTTIDATVTFRDSSGYETNGSPVASRPIGSRESLAVSIPHRPNMTTRLYYRANNGTWNWADADEGAKRLWVDFIPGIREADPPGVNTFPNSDPSVMQASAGPFMVCGDGSGSWGPLTFNADGTMTSTQIPAWVPITSFASGFSPRSWGFAPAYRVWPDGKVEWRGIVTGTAMGTGQVEPFIIPVNARPTQHVQFAAASTSGVNIKRVEFRNSTDTDPNVFRVYHGGVSGNWVSLDGIYYYKN